LRPTLHPVGSRHDEVVNYAERGSIGAEEQFFDFMRRHEQLLSHTLSDAGRGRAVAMGMERSQNAVDEPLDKLTIGGADRTRPGNANPKSELTGDRARLNREAGSGLQSEPHVLPGAGRARQRDIGESGDRWAFAIGAKTALACQSIPVADRCLPYGGTSFKQHPVLRRGGHATSDVVEQRDVEIRPGRARTLNDSVKEFAWLRRHAAQEHPKVLS
jgi:hypothetical protein